MRLKASVFALLVATCYAALAQSPQQNPPRDDAYISQYQPAVKLTGDFVPIKDDPCWPHRVEAGTHGWRAHAGVHGSDDEGGRRADRPVNSGRPRGNPGAGWRRLDQYRTFSIELDSERAPGPGVRYGTRPDLPGSPHKPRCALRTDVERRPVEDDQLQSTAALVAGDDRHHPQHVGRQRGAREEYLRPSIWARETRSIPASADTRADQPTAARRGHPRSNSGLSTVIPDVKVDTSGAADVVLMGTNVGLFRSTERGRDLR